MHEKTKPNHYSKKLTEFIYRSVDIGEKKLFNKYLKLILVQVPVPKLQVMYNVQCTCTGTIKLGNSPRKLL
jgi:hypothetical protein